MLSYTLGTLNNKCYNKCADEQYQNLNDLFSSILIKGTKMQIKRGLIREYNQIDAVTSNVRGSIDITRSINSNYSGMQQKVAMQPKVAMQLVACSYDELTINSKPNQIIKATLKLLSKSDIQHKFKREINSVLLSLKEVETINVNHIDWNIHFNSSNKNYKMLLSICSLVIYGLDSEDTDLTLINQFFDEENMQILFKQFVIEYYKKHYKLYKMLSPKIKWNIQSSNGSLEQENALFKDMSTDIFLQNHDKKILIKTKFNYNILANDKNFDDVITQDIYQLYSMIKNVESINLDDVSGTLLYGITQRGIKDQEVTIGKNKISIKFINLNVNFTQIKRQLDDVMRLIN